MAPEGARYPHRCRLASISGVVPVLGWEWSRLVLSELCAWCDIASSVWACSHSRIVGYGPKEEGVDPSCLEKRASTSKSAFAFLTILALSGNIDPRRVRIGLKRLAVDSRGGQCSVSRTKK